MRSFVFITLFSGIILFFGASAPVAWGKNLNGELFGNRGELSLPSSATGEEEGGEQQVKGPLEEEQANPKALSKTDSAAVGLESESGEKLIESTVVDAPQALDGKKPILYVVPTLFSDDFTASERSILVNRLTYLLSKFYRLTRANSDENQRTFSARILREKGLTQLIATLTISGGEFIEEKICQNCDIVEIHSSTRALVGEMARRDDEIPSSLTVRFDNEVETGFGGKESRLKWHIVASSITVVSLWLSLREVERHNSLVSENRDLKSSLSRSHSSSAILSLKSRINKNDEEIKSSQRNYQFLSIIMLGGLAWEGYLLYQEYKAVKTDEERERVTFNVNYQPKLALSTLSLRVTF